MMREGLRTVGEGLERVRYGNGKCLVGISQRVGRDSAKGLATFWQRFGKDLETTWEILWYLWNLYEPLHFWNLDRCSPIQYLFSTEPAPNPYLRVSKSLHKLYQIYTKAFWLPKSWQTLEQILTELCQVLTKLYNILTEPLPNLDRRKCQSLTNSIPNPYRFLTNPFTEYKTVPNFHQTNTSRSLPYPYEILEKLHKSPAKPLPKLYQAFTKSPQTNNLT